MSFYTNSKDISTEKRGNKTFLTCQSKKHDQTWTAAEIDLDEFLGNNNGQFEWGGASFTQSAENVRLERGPQNIPILRARLRNINGEWIDSWTYPSNWILNVDGKLLFSKPRNLRDYEIVSDDRTFLLCQAQRDDGSWAPAKIDLDAFIGNDDGNFDWSGKMSGFTQSAQKVLLRFEGPIGDLKPIIKTTLKTRGGEWKSASLDLFEAVKNDDGKLVPLLRN